MLTPEEIKQLQWAVAVPLKRWLRPHEALFYTGLGKSTLYRKCKEYGIYANKNGFYDRQEIDLMLSGAPSRIEREAKKIKVPRQGWTNH